MAEERNREELETRAAELGVAFTPETSDEDLRTSVEEAEAKADTEADKVDSEDSSEQA